MGMTMQTPTPPAPQIMDGRGRHGNGHLTHHRSEVEGSGRPAGALTARTQITYDALIDYLLNNPRVTNKEMAAAFGYQAQTISIILNSDGFKQKYEKRRGEVVDPILTQTIEARMGALAQRSAEIVAEQLDLNPTDKKFALQVLERTMPQQAKQTSGPTVQLGFIVKLPGPAASSEEWSSKVGPTEMVLPRVEELPSENPEGLQVTVVSGTSGEEHF